MEIASNTAMQITAVVGLSIWEPDARALESAGADVLSPVDVAELSPLEEIAKARSVGGGGVATANVLTITVEMDLVSRAL